MRLKPRPTSEDQLQLHSSAVAFQYLSSMSASSWLEVGSMAKELRLRLNQGVSFKSLALVSLRL